MIYAVNLLVTTMVGVGGEYIEYYTEAFLGAFRIPPLFEAIIKMIMISPLSTSTVAVSIQSAAAKALEPKKESSILRSNAVVDAAAAALPFMLSTRPSSSRQHCASVAVRRRRQSDQ